MREQTVSLLHLLLIERERKQFTRQSHAVRCIDKRLCANLWEKKRKNTQLTFDWQLNKIIIGFEKNKEKVFNCLCGKLHYTRNYTDLLCWCAHHTHTHTLSTEAYWSIHLVMTATIKYNWNVQKNTIFQRGFHNFCLPLVVQTDRGCFRQCVIVLNYKLLTYKITNFTFSVVTHNEFLNEKNVGQDLMRCQL